jgi:predicted enzyme related to lactoylglutathione lyase
VYRTNVIAPLALTQALWPFLAPDARIFNISSDAGAEAYAGWGGYGSSKAALEQITAVFAAENPERRIYWVDPGDMRTQMHQEAFPGEDIGDRPLPEESVPGFIHLIEGNLPSGRYQAHAITAEKPQTPAIRELRAALTVQQFEDTVRVFRDQMGLSVTLEWSTPEGRGVVLDAGRATLEIVDGAQAETIDHVEVGQRVSGPVRLALEVGDVEATAKVLQDQGTTVLHEAVLTPWGDYNQRVQTPEGVQITLYQAGVAKADEVIS